MDLELAVSPWQPVGCKNRQETLYTVVLAFLVSARLISPVGDIFVAEKNVLLDLHGGGDPSWFRLACQLSPIVTKPA